MIGARSSLQTTTIEEKIGQLNMVASSHAVTRPGSVANQSVPGLDGSELWGSQAVSDFKGRHFEGEIVLWAVRWYCRYGVSYPDLEQMMGERGVSVDHSTIYRWVQKYAPEIEKRLRWQWRHPQSTSWQVDETYVKVGGKWTYICRALDKQVDPLNLDQSAQPARFSGAKKAEPTSRRDRRRRQLARVTNQTVANWRSRDWAAAKCAAATTRPPPIGGPVKVGDGDLA
jgi:DDE domain